MYYILMKVIVLALSINSRDGWVDARYPVITIKDKDFGTNLAYLTNVAGVRFVRCKFKAFPRNIDGCIFDGCTFETEDHRLGFEGVEICYSKFNGSIIRAPFSRVLFVEIVFDKCIFEQLSEFDDTFMDGVEFDNCTFKTRCRISGTQSYLAFDDCKLNARPIPLEGQPIITSHNFEEEALRDYPQASPQ